MGKRPDKKLNRRPNSRLDKKQLVRRTEEYVRKMMQDEPTGHDWWHVSRVRKTALAIAKKEKADRFIVELSALLHDLDDWKFSKGGLGEPVKAARWLKDNKVPEKDAAHIIDIIKNISFRGGTTKSVMTTIEGMVVQDADRLDAIGAMGISRTFAYGGNKGREIYNPSIRPAARMSFLQYKNSKGTSLNHFYEKLFLLKGLMNTKTAKRVAEKRHKFMERFLEEFYKEWDGKDL